MARAPVGPFWYGHNDVGVCWDAHLIPMVPEVWVVFSKRASKKECKQDQP